MRVKRLARMPHYGTLHRLLLQAELAPNALQVALLMKGELGDIDATFETVRQVHSAAKHNAWLPLLNVLKETLTIMRKGNHV